MTAILDHYLESHSDATPGRVQARRAAELLVEWLVGVQRKTRATAADFSGVWQQEFIRWLAAEKKHACGTISREMSVIAAAMGHALKRIIVEEEGKKREVQLLKFAVPVIYKNEEVSRLTGLAEPAPRDWLPTWEQMANFIDRIGRRTANGEWNKDSENLFRFTVILLNTWARPEAILDLKVSTQVNFEAGIVKLNPPERKQTKKVRPAIALTENLSGWLRTWGDDRPIHVDGEPVGSMKRTFKRHALALELPKFTPYTIRHFMATNVRRTEGVTVDREQRQEWLGHKKQDTTSWYEHHDPEWLLEARRATDQIILRLNGLLKKRTLLPSCSEVAPKSSVERGPLKLVVSK
ncbi:hypothetical protein BH10PSE7_BH10PSE7_15040 [soil metagenome]